MLGQNNLHVNILIISLQLYRHFIISTLLNCDSKMNQKYNLCPLNKSSCQHSVYKNTSPCVHVEPTGGLSVS